MPPEPLTKADATYLLKFVIEAYDALNRDMQRAKQLVQMCRRAHSDDGVTQTDLAIHARTEEAITSLCETTHAFRRLSRACGDVRTRPGRSIFAKTIRPRDRAP